MMKKTVLLAALLLASNAANASLYNWTYNGSITVQGTALTFTGNGLLDSNQADSTGSNLLDNNDTFQVNGIDIAHIGGSSDYANVATGFIQTYLDGSALSGVVPNIFTLAISSTSIYLQLVDIDVFTDFTGQGGAFIFSPVSEVPLPSSLALLFSSMLGFFGVRRKDSI